METEKDERRERRERREGLIEEGGRLQKGRRESK